MAEQDATPLPPPPPLPPKLADPVPAIVAGTVLWFLGLAGVLLFGRGDTVLVWTCLTGGLLGIIGYGVFTWQRSAARRGSRTAQHGQGLD
ncbi:DUF2530 domain-containing protein [Saccharothrix isguenensis]